MREMRMATMRSNHGCFRFCFKLRYTSCPVVITSATTVTVHANEIDTPHTTPTNTKGYTYHGAFVANSISSRFTYARSNIATVHTTTRANANTNANFIVRCAAE